MMKLCLMMTSRLHQFNKQMDTDRGIEGLKLQWNDVDDKMPKLDLQRVFSEGPKDDDLGYGKHTNGNFHIGDDEFIVHGDDVDVVYSQQTKKVTVESSNTDNNIKAKQKRIKKACNNSKWQQH